MSNPFYSAMGGGMNLSSMLQQIKANPIGFILSTKGINIPEQAASDPNSIIQYLLSTGQVSQAQVNNAYMAAPRNNFWRM